MHPVIRYAGVRLIHALFVLFGTSALVFIAMYVATDPVRTMLPLGTSDDVIEQTRAALGLDGAVLDQYRTFIGNAITLDFGESLWLRTDALNAALDRLPATAVLVVTATLIGVAVGSAIGLTAAIRAGGAFDEATGLVTYLLMSLAEFWVALVGIIVVAVGLGWVATGGYGLDFRHAALPVFVLAIRPAAYSARLMRTAAGEELAKPYVLTAQAMGAGDGAVAVRHVLRNAATPTMTTTLYNMSKMFIGAAAAVEVVFAWPGIGPLAVGALRRGDIFLVQAIVAVTVVTVVVLNLVADALAMWLDPRTRGLVVSGAAR